MAAAEAHRNAQMIDTITAATTTIMILTPPWFDYAQPYGLGDINDLCETLSTAGAQIRTPFEERPRARFGNVTTHE